MKNELPQDSRLIEICNALQIHGFDARFTTLGICLNPEGMGIRNASIEFYILKNCPKQIRARLRVKPEKNKPETGISDVHTDAGLKYLSNILEEAVYGVAKLGRFFYFGCRNGIHYYYAHVEVPEYRDDVSIQQKLLKKTLRQLEGMDAKTFRENLDESGLPRSSIVRLALTRIFRSAADPKELMNVTSREAQRIVNAEEWKTVRGLVSNNRTNRISNMVSILWEEVSRQYMKKAWEKLRG